MAALNTEARNDYARIGQGPSPVRDFIGRLRTDRGLLRRVLMLGGIAIAALVSVTLWLMGGRYVSTDDAYVQAAKLMVSTDVSGLVKSVEVREGQHVTKGDVLFRLDPQPFRIALESAKAKLSQTVLDIESMKQDYRRMLSNVAAQQAQVDLDERNYQRYASLVRANAIAPATYDQARLTLANDREQLIALQQTAQTQLAKLGGNIDLPVQKQPQYRQAQAQVTEAQRQLDHAVVRAPFSGVVTEVDSLQPGTLVISAMSAFTTTSAVGLVSDSDIWVEGNMKETDLTHVHNGQPVEVTVDTYPGCRWQGELQAVSQASGSTFSPLPSENTSGNWVKVVQRIPVRVRLKQSDCNVALRAGMSSTISIDTGRYRWQRLLFD